MLIGKLTDGTLVSLIKYADQVQFSDQPGWLLVCFDFEQPVRRQINVKWIPSSTKFTWVVDFLNS